MINKILKSKTTLVMGILNITPDSFSDGGLYLDTTKAFHRTKQMLAEGADIIDIGGESTRPGSKPVSCEEQIKRVVPVIKMIKEKLGNHIIISIDTNKALVAEAGLNAGAYMINSLGGFTVDPAMAKVIAQRKCPIVVYHIKGEPKTMQKGKVNYKNVVAEINEFFKQQIEVGRKHGVKKDQFILDPGIGFGKSIEHNIAIIKKFAGFKKRRLPLLVGVSRKSHLGEILKQSLNLETVPEPEERVDAGLAEVAIAVLNGAKIVRTHDVLATKKFLAVLDKFK